MLITKYKIATAASGNVLSVSTDVKPALNINSGDTYWDTFLTGLVATVENEAESYCRRSFLTSTWDAYADSWDTEYELLRGQITSISYIKYQDVDNATQTLSTSNYSTDIITEPGRIKIINAPSLYADGYNAVNIRFVAGWATASAVPQLLKTAMLVRINDLFAGGRQSIYVGTQVNVIPMWFEKMLNPYKIDW